MLVKEWNVAYAFDIRYKHLLVNRKDQLETDEDIDHILQAGSDPKNDSNDEDNQDDDMEDQEEGDDDEDEDEGDVGQDGISGKYLQSSGYTKAPLYPPPALPRQQSKQQKPRKSSPTKQTPPLLPPAPPQGMYGYGAQMPGYGPQQLDPWGRPIPGYGGQNSYSGHSYGPYGGYGSYGSPPFGAKGARHGSQQPPQHGMHHFPPHFHPMTPTPSIHDSEYGTLGPNPHNRGRFTPFHDNQTPGFEMQGHFQGGRATKIKRESPTFEERPMDINEMDGPTNDLGLQDDNADDKATVDAEVETLELELKLAKAKARAAMLKQQGKK
jgi:hypothetical protein